MATDNELVMIDGTPATTAAGSDEARREWAGHRWRGRRRDSGDRILGCHIWPRRRPDGRQDGRHEPALYTAEEEKELHRGQDVLFVLLERHEGRSIERRMELGQRRLRRTTTFWSFRMETWLFETDDEQRGLATLRLAQPPTASPLLLPHCAACFQLEI